MEYNSLVSKNNLKLAWHRIQTGQNTAYKRFFRQMYAGYAAGLDQNLIHLNRMLKGAWEPTSPTREHIPKPSGLQRPLTLLSLEDQIVFQAVANAFAKKMRAKRNEVEGKAVFSNMMGKDDKSIFLFLPWRYSYGEFRKQVETYFSSGLTWIAHFDLSAFYDTISHELLINIVSPRKGHWETWEKVRGWFKCWSSSEDKKSIQHGIPQGPIASDCLAECLLYPLDKVMLDKGASYIRYVDDIRIFASSKLELQKEVITLEQWCRGSGLMPHGDKFAIKEATSVKDALGSLPSIRNEGDSLFPLQAKKAERLFKGAIEGKPQRIAEKSRARFVLYRAEESKKLLDWTLRLLPRHPEHIDAFVAFLSNYEKSKRIENALMRLIREGIPYEYVRGELWLILSNIGSSRCLNEMRSLAKKELKEASSLVLQWGAMSFLLACERNGIGRTTYKILNCNPIVQSLLVPLLQEEHYEREGIASRLLDRGDYQIGVSMGHELAVRRIKPSDLGIRNRDLGVQVQNSFKGLGCIRRRRGGPVDQVGLLISKRYEVSYSQDWTRLLGEEYEYALSILVEADGLYDASPSMWIQQQDAFNDVVIRRFIELLNARRLPGGIKTKNRRGRLVDYGELLEPNNGFDKKYPVIAGHFREVHRRRSTVPQSHPYEKKGGARNKHLKHRERLKYLSELEYGYGALIAVISHVL